MIKFGIDYLINNHLDQLKDSRVGLVTKNAAITRDLIPTRRVLQSASANLTALNSPEHGLSSHYADGVAIAYETDALSLTCRSGVMRQFCQLSSATTL